MRITQLSSCAAVTSLASVAAVSCGGGAGGAAKHAEVGASIASSAHDVPLEKSAYPVFPNADVGADPAVAAEQGGRGFTGKGWDTNTGCDLIGDPRAVKGGVFREAITDSPATLRFIGPNLSVWNSKLSGMVYESLLGRLS